MVHKTERKEYFQLIQEALFKRMKKIALNHAEILKSGHMICVYCLLPYPIAPTDPEYTQNRKPLCDACVEEIKKTR